jgi:hypothetical protein
MVEVKDLKSKEVVYAAIAIIFVTAALVTLPYQNQVAEAQPMTMYQFRVTLTDVPSNAEDLIMNATVTQGFAPINWQIKTVSSPSEGEVVRFAVKVPSGGNEDSFFICGMQETSGINSCEHHDLPSNDRGPIRVNYQYPS